MSTVVVIEPRAQNLVVTEDNLLVDLNDGRSISVPLAWYPRLQHGTPDGRNPTVREGAAIEMDWRPRGNSLARSGRRHQCRESVARLCFGRESGLVSAVVGRPKFKPNAKGAIYSNAHED